MMRHLHLLLQLELQLQVDRSGRGKDRMFLTQFLSVLKPEKLLNYKRMTNGDGQLLLSTSKINMINIEKLLT